MRRRLFAVSAAALMAVPICARAAVPVEQIEAEEALSGTDPHYHYLEYAPVEFGGSATVAGTGTIAGITFHAVDTLNDTNTFDPTFHATKVGTNMYSNTSAGSPFVTDVYNGGALDFLLNTAQQYNSNGGQIFTVGVRSLPSHFPTGVLVLNNSWVSDWALAQGITPATATTASQDLNSLRTFDFMVNRDNVLSVAGAVGTIYDSNNNTYYQTPLVWDSYNTLAVSGDGFSPGTQPLKQHADLNLAGEASFATATVSGYATALYGTAQAAGQTDAVNSYVGRSLLLAGATKTFYASPGGGTAGAMNAIYGAGQPNYNNSLAILQSGEKTLQTLTTGFVIGAPATVQHGWATTTILANTSSAVLFQSTNAITGITASLNWNVTSQSNTSANTINTSNGAVVFPNLNISICPVTFTGGHYVIGSPETNPVFSSAVSGDNTQYIYSTVGLPAGTYAILVNGDPTLSAAVGLSYTLAGSFASRWNISTGGSWGNAANWSNGIPNGQAAQANLLASPGITSPATINLDGERTVGQITFNNSNGYTIAQGTVLAGVTGALLIDDTGDSTGTVNPLIAVLAGNQTISAPMILASGLTVNTSAGSMLNLTGVVTSTNGGVTKIGAGTVLINAADAFGGAIANGGTITLGSAGSINGTLFVNAGATGLYSAGSGSGMLTRNLSGGININSSGTVIAAASMQSSNRQLIVVNGGLTIAGVSNNWTGKLDLNNNDMDVPTGSLADITNQISEGYNGGTWTGVGGIVSSSAAGNSQHLTTIGVIANNQGGGALFTSFDGYAVGAGDILLKYTYYGDATLDGRVDGSDYTRIDSGFSQHLTGWYNGDFNYDGIINGSDYTLIDNAFNMQGTQISSEIAGPIAGINTQLASEFTGGVGGFTAAVPEPSTLLWTLPIAGLLSRRRKQLSGTV